MTRTQASDSSTETTTNDDTITRPKSDRQRALEKMGSIKVNLNDVINTLRKNNQNEPRRGKHVLRVTPPYSDVNTAQTHFSERGRHYVGDAPYPIHISPECFVTGDQEGYASYKWKSQYNFPSEHESKSIYENEADDGVEWEDWWQESIEMWEREIRHAIGNTDTISFRPDEVNDDAINIPIEIVG